MLQFALYDDKRRKLFNMYAFSEFLFYKHFRSFGTFNKERFKITVSKERNIDTSNTSKIMMIGFEKKLGN